MKLLKLYKIKIAILTIITVIISGRLITNEIIAPTNIVSIATQHSFIKLGIMISLYDFPNVCNVNMRFLFSFTHN